MPTWVFNPQPHPPPHSYMERKCHELELINVSFSNKKINVHLSFFLKDIKQEGMHYMFPLHMATTTMTTAYMNSKCCHFIHLTLTLTMTMPNTHPICPRYTPPLHPSIHSSDNNNGIHEQQVPSLHPPHPHLHNDNTKCASCLPLLYPTWSHELCSYANTNMNIHVCIWVSCSVALQGPLDLQVKPAGFVPIPVTGMGTGSILYTCDQAHAHGAGTGMGKAMDTHRFTCAVP